MTNIYFTNHQKPQTANFLKKYLCTVYVINYPECQLQEFTFK